MIIFPKVDSVYAIQKLLEVVEKHLTASFINENRIVMLLPPGTPEYYREYVSKALANSGLSRVTMLTYGAKLPVQGLEICFIVEDGWENNRSDLFLLAFRLSERGHFVTLMR